jgi:hypothetical protein
MYIASLALAAPLRLQPYYLCRARPNMSVHLFHTVFDRVL